MKKLISTTLILILSIGFFATCKKDKGAPPSLPPEESMFIDFSNFTTGKKSADLTPATKGIDDFHYVLIFSLCNWEACFSLNQIQSN